MELLKTVFKLLKKNIVVLKLPGKIDFFLTKKNLKTMPRKSCCRVADNLDECALKGLSLDKAGWFLKNQDLLACDETPQLFWVAERFAKNQTPEAIELLTFLLQSGHDPNGEMGLNPLHVLPLTEDGSLTPMQKVLIEYGADPNIGQKRNEVYQYLIEFVKSPEDVKFLREKGALYTLFFIDTALDNKKEYPPELVLDMALAVSTDEEILLVNGTRVRYSQVK